MVIFERKNTPKGAVSDFGDTGRVARGMLTSQIMVIQREKKKVYLWLREKFSTMRDRRCTFGAAFFLFCFALNSCAMPHEVT